MRSMAARLSWLGLVLLGCGVATPSGDAGEGTGALRQPIAGGSLDLEHAAVFELLTRWGEGVSSCTATLIAPNLLVTARHCISPGARTNIICGEAELGSAVTGDSVYVTNDPTPGPDSAYYRGAEVHVQPESADTCGWDVALVVLDENVPDRIATPLVPRIDLEGQPGESYVAIGYGVNEQGYPNQGRMLLGDLEVRCSTNCDRRYQVVTNEFMGETGVCSGDSGGPALDAAGKVIGVVSRGSDPCATPIYGSVAAWRDWIVETAFHAAALGGYPAPFWAFSGSSDVSPDLFGAGASCQLSEECRPGHACYFASDPAEAACTAICETDAQCPRGKQCAPGFPVRGGGLCLAPSAPSEPVPGAAGADDGDDGGSDAGRGAEDGCSMHGRPASPSDGLVWLGALAFLAASRRARVSSAGRRKSL